MRSLAGSVLVRRVGTSHLHTVTEVGKGAVDVSAAFEFAAAVHAYILVWANRGVVGQPIVDPCNRRCLGRESTAIQASTVMVSDERITGSAIHTDEVVLSLGIVTLLDHETKIDGYTLIAHRRPHGGGRAGRLFAEFGSKTDGYSSRASGRVKAGILLTKRCMVESRLKLRWPRR